VTQRRLCDGAGFKIGADETSRVRAFGFDHAWVQRADANLARAEFMPDSSECRSEGGRVISGESDARIHYSAEQKLRRISMQNLQK
jgi:hypothetical protein